MFIKHAMATAKRDLISTFTVEKICQLKFGFHKQRKAYFTEDHFKYQLRRQHLRTIDRLSSLLLFAECIDKFDSPKF